MLVHRDAHDFRIDEPMTGGGSGRRVETFTRVVAFGEFDNHRRRLDVSPGNPSVFVFDRRGSWAGSLVRQ